MSVTQEETPWRTGGPEAAARRRRLLVGVLVLFALVGAVFGFPTGREVITAWVLLFLWAACAGDWKVWRRAVRRDWLALIVVLFAYDRLRGLADEVGARLTDLPTLRNGRLTGDTVDRAHVLPQLRVDEWLFGGTVPTVWLQEHLYTRGDPQWYDAFVVPVYMSHFVVPLGLAVALWATQYHHFRRYIATFVTLTAATLTTYALLPAAPPWMASLNGYLPPGIGRVTSETLRATGVHTVQSAVQRGEDYANAVAALPSLHAAVPMMVLLFAWPLVRRRARALLVTYVLAMVFTLVYGGEHYVSDVLMGWAYAAAAVFGVRWVASRRARADTPTP